MGDSRNVELRIVIFERVETCVVAKIALKDLLLRSIDIALNYKVAILGNVDVVSYALHKFYRLASQQTCQEVLVNTVGQWCCCRVGIYGVATNRHRYGHLLASGFVTLVVTCARLVAMPMHSRSVVVKHLHTVHSHIAKTSLGIYGMHHRKGYKSPSVVRPTLQNWQ